MFGTEPVYWEEGGKHYAAYTATRLLFRRDVFDQLPEGSIVIISIRPRQGPISFFQIPKTEICRVFENVLRTKSWREKGVYHYPKLPLKAEPFLVSPEKLPPRCRRWFERVPRNSTVAPMPTRRSRSTDDSPTPIDESPAYLRAVRVWRETWRPRRVRLLLVAKSHVGELPGDLDVEVTVPGHPDLPPAFCRLVYCLGYGDSSICKPKPGGIGGPRSTGRSSERSPGGSRN